MASHVTFTPAANLGVAKGLNAQAGANAEATGEGGLMGAFAALLGVATQASTATAAAETTADASLGHLAGLSFEASFDGEQDGQAEDPEAVAAVIDVALPFQATVDTKAMLTDLVDSLAELKVQLDAGGTVDPELLKRVNAALDALGAQFNIDLSAAPSLDELKALAANALPDDASATGQLTLALAPLAETLLSGSATADGSANAEFSALIRSIGDKLGALLQSLNGDGVSPEKLAALGLDAEAGIKTDLEIAIAKLLDPAVKVEASANAQILATPKLEIAEPVLTGKAQAEVAVEPPETKPAPERPDAPIKLAPVSADQAGTDTGDEQPSKDSHKTVEVKVAATAAAVVAETAPTEQQVAAQPAHIASRIDASAARPIVIQAGYQTSQQQLNLPQLAFELVRQVNDGNTRFQMRLDPPELGKIDVKLDIDSTTGQINARLTVERAETLDLMQRDQRGLERALQQAGLDSAKTNLEFSLKQSPFNGGGQQGNEGGGQQPRFGTDAADGEDTPPPTVNLYRGSLTASGVNIIA